MNIIHKVLLGLALGFTAIDFAAGAMTGSERLANQRVLAQFPIDRDPDVILLPVRFKEKEHWFLLDTGSSHTAFDTSLSHDLGAATRIVRVQTAANPIVAALFEAPEAFLGPLNLQDCGEVACVNLKMLSSLLGRPVAGIIGMNFLKEYAIQMDFDEGTLSFIQPMGTDKSAWGKNLGMYCSPAGFPQITGRIFDRIDVDFLIDTGANGAGCLEIKIFNKILADKELRTSSVLTQTLSGTNRCREFRIEDLSVGSLKYRDLIFTESGESRLGLSFLSRHMVTFDFPNGKIYLREGDKFNRVEQTDMSGLHLYRISNETVAYSVDEGSPAQKAGIKDNDVILKINDDDVDQHDIRDIRELLRSTDRRKILMVIRRGNDAKEVSFLLEKRI